MGKTLPIPFHALIACAALCVAARPACAAPDHVDITWMSITNLYLDFGATRIIADGYITRLPQEIFSGGGGGLATTHKGMRPDAAAVREVFAALGGKSAITLLISGHSHFDHTFDTPVWARLSGAPIVGSPTTCLQVAAAGIPARRCRAVYGGERIDLSRGVRMFVIRWNHSGDPAKNPEQHNPRELDAPPVADATGGLRAGVAEDFPNGGGSRAYLFVIDAPGGPISVFFQDSASPIDLTVPIVLEGHDYGAPLENLKVALAQAGLDHVDLWIGTGGRDVAALVLPVLEPRAYLPVHWDGLFRPFKAGVEAQFSDPELAKALADSGVRLIAPTQYMDRWRLDRNGVHPLDNARVKHALGFH
jgi:L-ascorbate metabolism protein UlaG (beta-lactamase superfamily)